MAKAGWCAQCQANVWLTEEGGCPNGHGASEISNVYDVPDGDDLSRTAGEIGDSLAEAGQEAVKLGKQGLDWLSKQLESKPGPGDPGAGPGGAAG